VVDGARASEQRAQRAVNPSGLFFPAAYLARRMRKGAYVMAALDIHCPVARPHVAYIPAPRASNLLALGTLASDVQREFLDCALDCDAK
jgi:hypothetical protein